MEVYEIILFVGFGLVYLKAITIGSEFNFYYWFKYKKEYTDWYFNRDEFNPKN